MNTEKLIEKLSKETDRTKLRLSCNNTFLTWCLGVFVVFAFLYFFNVLLLENFELATLGLLCLSLSTAYLGICSSFMHKIRRFIGGLLTIAGISILLFFVASKNLEAGLGSLISYWMHIASICAIISIIVSTLFSIYGMFLLYYFGSPVNFISIVLMNIASALLGIVLLEGSCCSLNLAHIIFGHLIPCIFWGVLITLFVLRYFSWTKRIQHYLHNMHSS